MKHSRHKITTYTPIFIGFLLVYATLDINMTWIWRIPRGRLGIFYLGTLSFWYLGSWLFILIKCKAKRKATLKSLSESLQSWLFNYRPTRHDDWATPTEEPDIEPAEEGLLEKSIALFNRRMFLMQLGYLPAFFGIYLTHWVLRVFVYPFFGMHTSIAWMSTGDPAFAVRLDFTFAAIALFIFIIWFVVPMSFVKKGLSKIEAVLLLNAASVLALIHFLHSYFTIHRNFIIHELGGVEWAITAWGGVANRYGDDYGGIWWPAVDPMHFYEPLNRFFIRFAPWIPTTNTMLLVFIGFGLLFALSVTGAGIGGRNSGSSGT